MQSRNSRSRTDSGLNPTGIGITATLRGRADAAVRLGDDSDEGRRGMYESRMVVNYTPSGG